MFMKGILRFVDTVVGVSLLVVAIRVFFFEHKFVEGSIIFIAESLYCLTMIAGRFYSKYILLEEDL